MKHSTRTTLSLAAVIGAGVTLPILLFTREETAPHPPSSSRIPAVSANSAESTKLRELRRAAIPGDYAPFAQVTRAWDGFWLARYPGVDAARPNLDSDGDGRSNFDEMLLDTDPFNGLGHLQPDRQAAGTLTTPMAGPTPDEIAARTLADVPRLREEARAYRENLVAAAADAGLPLRVEEPGERVSLLSGFDDEGTAIYTKSS